MVKNEPASFEMLRVGTKNKSHEREIICSGCYLDKGPFALEQHAESTFDGRIPEIVDKFVVFLFFLSCPFRVKLVAVSYVAFQDNEWGEVEVRTRRMWRRLLCQSTIRRLHR